MQLNNLIQSIKNDLDALNRTRELFANGSLSAVEYKLLSRTYQRARFYLLAAQQSAKKSPSDILGCPD